MLEDLNEQQGEVILDKVIDISLSEAGEHDPGKLMALTEKGLIWCLDGVDGYGPDPQTKYWYRISCPPGCVGADGQ